MAISAGTRNYVFFYEATLGNGEVIRGPVSKPYTVEMAGGLGRTTLTVSTLRHTQFGIEGGTREDCRVVAARTVDGDTSKYYRITNPNSAAPGFYNRYTRNTTTADSVQIVDEMDDDTLLLQEELYTTGGVSSNDPIPGTGIVAVCRGRLFSTDPSNPSIVYHSQELAEGYAVENSPELRIVFPPDGGAVTAIAEQNGVTIGFKRHAIYGVTGDGPLANPETGGWSNPTLISADVGCVDQRTIVSTPVGIMFQSTKGIYLLDRGMNVSYIGAPVEAYNGQRITRATLLENTHQVRFLTDDGATLLYDYQFGQWSTFTNHEGVDAVLVRGVYHYLRNDGRVFRQSTEYRDANLQIPLVIETAWVRLGETIQGFQYLRKVQVIGTWKSACVLRVQWMLDYDVDGNWSEPVEFDATSMGGSNYGDGNYGDGNYGGESPQPFQFTAHIGKRCQAARFRISFYEAAGAAGACAELTEMVIEGGAKGPLYKLPVTRSR